MTFKSIIQDSDKQQSYMRDIYSRFWRKSRIAYGIEQYDKDLIRQFSTDVARGPVGNILSILEVGIGDGYPFADQLSRMGFQLYGIDLSPAHVAMVKQKLPDVRVECGDAQDLRFPDHFFDGVYCFRSSWYFPDLETAIREMLRVLKTNGLLMFDIQNWNHPPNRQRVERLLKRSAYPLSLLILSKHSRNIVKLLLRPIKYYQCDWSTGKHVIISSSPTDPNDLNISSVRLKLE